MNKLYKIIYVILKYPLDFKKIRKVKNSEYFDKDYYSYFNNGVKMPLINYFYFGWKDNKNPSYSFSNKKYLDRYTDALLTYRCPLLHYEEIGKSEGRIVEYDENIPNIKKWYESKYHKIYSYDIVWSNIKKKINVFLKDKISDDLLKFIIKYAKDNSYDINLINSKDKDIKEKNISYMNISMGDFLNCNPLDIFITNNKDDLNALYNNKTILSNIYYYTEEDSIINDPRIIVLSNKDNLNIKKLSIEFKLNKKIPKSGIIYCDNNSLYGLNLLNNLFLRNVITGIWTIYIKDDVKSFFELDSHILVKTVKNIPKNVNFIITNNSNDDNICTLTYKEDYKKENYINISKNINIKTNNQFIDNNYLELEKVIKKG